MPTREANVARKNTESPMLSKKLKMACDERLSLSREKFNLSRKRVEKLKRSHIIKRQVKVEKPAENAWITSGHCGSRDAVLVFRASVLKPQDRKSTTTISSPTPSSQSLKDCDEDEQEAIPLPSSSKDVHKVPTETVGQRKSEKSQKFLKSNLQKTNIKVKLANSLSSSDNSISSEGGCDFLSHVSNSSEKMQSNLQHIVNDPVDEDPAASTSNDDTDSLREGSEEDSIEVSFNPDMPALQMKITFKFMQTETKLLRKIFLSHGLSEVKTEENFSILWTGVHMKPDILRNLAPYQRVNHFPRSYELTRKDRLYKNIERMQHLRGVKHFDIVPQSFILPIEYKDLASAHNKHRGPWIVKPAASSRGRGIFIVNSPDQIPQDEQVLVSKYVLDPLCIDGHKCDLRVYVLVTSFDPLIIYIYEEGLVRLATVKYDRTSDNLWNPCMHLCNYSINKYHSDYIRSSDAQDEDVGHKWTLSALLRHLKSQGCDTAELMSNIEDLIIKSILACAQSIISACRMFVPSGNNCFELYGFDILIDDNLKPWLLEVNLSPSMGIDSPLDSRVKASLITDLLTCVGIPAFSPDMRAHYDSKWTRFRNMSCSRRTTSAEPVGGNGSVASRRLTVSGVPSQPPLTMEEQRIVRNARLQNARRGGFVRIFPTEDTMQRYCNFLDPATGIPLSTPFVQGSMVLPHNYNLMLFNNLYGKESRDNTAKEENSLEERMSQYERALPLGTLLLFNGKRIKSKCVEEGKRLRKQIMKMIDNGSELTQLQARQAFGLYLEAILRRISQEPRDFHEKLILKFLNRIGGVVKAPVFFRSPQNLRSINKSRSAMVAKLLGDFLEQYKRDTEAYVDAFDHFGMIPTGLFTEFLSQAQEADLEAILTLNTNVTGNMPYLYNRFGLSVPPTPPIPSGMHGFLRALPSMVVTGAAAREFNKCDGYYKNSDKDLSTFRNEKLPEDKVSKEGSSRTKNRC